MAWLLLVILLVLIALVARVDAAPGGAAIDLAMRHADAEPAEALDEDGDEEAGDRGPAPGGDDGGAHPGPVLDGDEADAALSSMLGRDDADARTSLALGEDDEAAGSAGPGVLAMLDAELAPGDATAGLDAADAGAMAGAQELYEQSMRHQRPSPWGRLDVGVSWRRRWSAPIVAPAHRHDELWLVATWRR